MPTYLQGTGNIQRQPAFQSADHLVHFLATASDKQWKPFRDMATDFMKGSKTPRRRLKKTSLHKIINHKPFHLLPLVHSEIHKHRTGDPDAKLAGGILEAIHTTGSAIGHALGFDRLAELIGLSPNTQPLTLHSEITAYLLHESYKPVGERKSVTIGYTRQTQYDSDLISVWKDAAGELLVCVRGSKLNWTDISQDVKILAGLSVNSKQLESTLSQIEKDFPNSSYSITAHSLGAAYVLSSLDQHRDHMDEIMLYNPASSPFQNTDKLRAFAHDDKIQWYMNVGDIVSNGLYQQFDQTHLEENVSMGPYRWSPLAAHSLSQFYEPALNIIKTNDARTPEPNYEAQKTSFEMIPELSVDTPETRAANLS